ncbi:MAG TPA: type IIL restriction-modification enzyme MmeI [Yoonia sp.]|nr:type IIL restriction-modification enzyme MmeI [Yoonia sp.]
MQSLTSISGLTPMLTGNSPYDGGNLLIDKIERDKLINAYPEANRFIKKLYGSRDYISGEQRYCIWVSDSDAEDAARIPELKERFDAVAAARQSGGQVAKTLSKHPHKFRYTHTAENSVIIVPRVSSENRRYIPVGLLPFDTIVSDSAQAIYDAPLWNLAILLSQIHMAWVKVLAGRLKTDIRYSSAICYNTFPVPKLTEKNRADLTAAAEGILLAREAHFPATIADLYDPEKMPANLRAAHDHNDEVLERIYIGRRFRNDTERLEKLFEMYTKMTTKVSA